MDLRGSTKADYSLASVMDYHILQRTVHIFQSSSAASVSSMIHSVFLCMSHLPTTLSSLLEVPFSKFWFAVVQLEAWPSDLEISFLGVKIIRGLFLRGINNNNVRVGSVDLILLAHLNFWTKKILPKGKETFFPSFFLSFFQLDHEGKKGDKRMDLRMLFSALCWTLFRSFIGIISVSTSSNSRKYFWFPSYRWEDWGSENSSRLLIFT